MKLRKILFSFDGRIGRRTYWLALLALIAAVLVLTFAPFLLGNEEWVFLILALTSQFIWLLSLWPLLAVGASDCTTATRTAGGCWFLAGSLRPDLWRLQHHPL